MLLYGETIVRTRTATLGILLILAFLVSCGKGEKPAGPDSATRDAAPAPNGDAGARPARTLPIPGAAGELPPGHPPLGAPAPGGIVPPPAGSGTGGTAIRWSVPAGWVEETPSSSMRKAQYRAPGAAGDAECVVFYFGPGQGGDPASNAARWAGQFVQPDGSPSEQAMKTSRRSVGAISVLEVEVTGTYTGGMTGGMAPAADKPGSMLLGAVAQGPDANWFFKLTGPEATVKAHRAAFEEMIGSLKSGS